MQLWTTADDVVIAVVSHHDRPFRVVKRDAVSAVYVRLPNTRGTLYAVLVEPRMVGIVTE